MTVSVNFYSRVFWIVIFLWKKLNHLTSIEDTSRRRDWCILGKETNMTTVKGLLQTDQTDQIDPINNRQISNEGVNQSESLSRLLDVWAEKHEQRRSDKGGRPEPGAGFQTKNKTKQKKSSIILCFMGKETPVRHQRKTRARVRCRALLWKCLLKWDFNGLWWTAALLLQTCVDVGRLEVQPRSGTFRFSV